MRVLTLLRRYGREDDGATAIEYALVTAIMSTAFIGILGTGGAVQAMYDGLMAIVDALSGAEADSGDG